MWFDGGEKSHCVRVEAECFCFKRWRSDAAWVTLQTVVLRNLGFIISYSGVRLFLEEYLTVRRSQWGSH